MLDHYTTGLHPLLYSRKLNIVRSVEMRRGLAVVSAAVPAFLPFLLALFLLSSVLTPLNIAAAVGAPHSPPSLSASASASASASGERPVVFVLKIEGEITEGTYLDISEGIESAEKEEHLRFSWK